MKLFTLVIAAYIVCISEGCNKSSVNALPSPTQVGSNTIGCLINGQAFVFQGTPSTLNYHGVEIFNKTADLGGYFVSAVNSGTSYNRLTFGIRSTNPKVGDIFNPASWWLNGVYISHYVQQENGVDVEYLFDSTISVIKITRFDTSVAAGTFEFHGSSGTKHLDITNGFFDVKMNN